MTVAFDGRWAPGIGDPTMLGWVTVLAYLAAALLCLACARRDRSGPRRFWGALGVLLLLLAVNKQLDVQSLLTQVGRDMALAQGWYAQRQQVQLAFIAGLGATTTIAGLMLALSLRRADAAVRWAVAGLVLLLAWIVTRAAAFHHIDRYMGWRVFGITLNGALELGAITVIALAAQSRWQRLRRSRA